MNNLTQREKVLVYLIIGILPVLLAFFGFNWFMGQLKAKTLELDAVSRQLSDIELRADLAMEKTQLKNQLKQRSLAANENVAQGEYREWLRTLVEDEIKFSGPPKVTARGNVDYKSDFGNKDVIYTQLTFQLDCMGSYSQIVEFLYRFYEKNYIQRITQLDLSLVKAKRVEGKVTYDRNLFKIKADIQVLSLVDADEVRAPLAVENRKLFYQSENQNRLISELEDYEGIILRRNLFGFPNNPPDFGSRKKEFDFEQGDRISLRLTADDIDEDELEFALVNTDGKVPSDRIEQYRDGSFRLDIEELGSYEFKATVVDKNYYPKSDEMAVVVNIEEKKPEPKPEVRPEPKPKFDPLKYTFLEAIVQDFEGTPLCWINIRPYGKMHKVTAGESFAVGKQNIQVVEIDRRTAVISIDGDHYRFEVNDALGDPQGDKLASSSPEPPQPPSPEETGETAGERTTERDVKSDKTTDESATGATEPREESQPSKLDVAQNQGDKASVSTGDTPDRD